MINCDLFPLTSMLISGGIFDKWNLFVRLGMLDTSDASATVFNNSMVHSVCEITITM